MPRFLRRISALFVLCCTANAMAEKPIQHMQVDVITEAASAEMVFQRDTAKLQALMPLTDSDLAQVHQISYTLEQSIAYYVSNASDSAKAQAAMMAEQLESFHLHSESQRLADTEAALQQYLSTAANFKP